MRDFNAIAPLEINHARDTKEALIRRTKDFKRGCDEDGEDMLVTALNAGQIIYVKAIGALGANLILLMGHTDDGTYVEVYQHWTQISITMHAKTKDGTLHPERRIGFNDRYLGDVEAESLDVPSRDDEQDRPA